MSGAIVAAGAIAAGLWLKSQFAGGETRTDAERNARNQGDQKPLTLSEVEDVARRTVGGGRFSTPPSVLVALAFVESSFRPWVVGDNGASHGITQVKTTTASWLHDDLGYADIGRPSAERLKDPKVGLYFAAAFLDWLSRYRGEPRAMTFQLQGYNAGAEGALRGNGSTYPGKIEKAHKRFYGVGYQGLVS